MLNHLVQVKVWGKYGCFTRPETKVERVSYPLLTPSAARGILEAIYWKPQFRWQVTEIWLLRHPELPRDESQFENYMPITLNELSCEGPEHPREYNLEDHRIQRTCLMLRWPCYLIRARAQIFCNTTNPKAIEEQFYRRLDDGQCFHQPYLGLRQFPAYFSRGDGAEEDTLDITEDLGSVVHSVVRPEGSKRVQYRFVPCSLKGGRFEVPEPEVTK